MFSESLPGGAEKFEHKKGAQWAPFFFALFSNFFLNLRGNHHIYGMVF